VSPILKASTQLYTTRHHDVMYKVKVKEKDRPVVISHVKKIKRSRQKADKLARKIPPIHGDKTLDGYEILVNQLGTWLKEAEGVIVS
jgi:hypothetical protein